eukprot:3293916-Amphidinium_carterae.2
MKLADCMSYECDLQQEAMLSPQAMTMIMFTLQSRTTGRQIAFLYLFQQAQLHQICKVNTNRHGGAHYRKCGRTLLQRLRPKPHIGTAWPGPHPIDC